MTSSAWSIGVPETTLRSTTDNLSNNTSSPPLNSSRGWTTVNLLWISLGPCMFVVGIAGNILILLVMCQSKMRGTSTCVYLKAMAVADLVAITTGVVPDCLEHTGYTILKEIDPVLCKLEKFIFYTSSDTSVWVCVAFTIDRFVAVCFPLESMRCCPPSHARYYSVAVFAAAVCKNLHVLVTRGAEFTKSGELVSNCGYPNDDYKHFEKFVRPWLAFTFINLLPFGIIVFCNVFIVRAMIEMRRSHRRSAIVSTKDSYNLTQMTVLCLSASICFLVCETPSMILLIGRPYWSVNPDSKTSYDIAKAAGNITFYVNHCINFFLYCMTGRKFRLALRSLFSRDSLAGGGFNSTTPRNSMELVNVLRIREGLHGKSGRYASAPCIAADLMGRAPAAAAGRSGMDAWQHRTYLQMKIAGRAASDERLLNGHIKSSSAQGLLERESRI